MKITSITVGYSRLVTDGNYSNRRYSCELTAGFNFERDGAWESCRDLLEKKVVEYVESKIKEEQVHVIAKEEYDRLKSLISSIKNFDTNGLPF